MLWLLLGLLFAGGLALLLAGDAGTIAGLDAGTFASLVVASALAIWIGGSLFSDYRGRLSQAAKDATIWIGLALLLVVGYSFRDEARHIWRRVAGELAPPGTTIAGTDGEQSVRLRRRPGGHFVANVVVNNVPLSMLVDTGASVITLKAADATALGIDVDALSFSIPVKTANGTAYSAPVRLRRVAIGGIAVDGLEALVARPGALNESLLGMNFLNRLRSYEFTGEFLTLRS
jgi:aspartyl protease family protein